MPSSALKTSLSRRPTQPPAQRQLTERCCCRYNIIYRARFTVLPESLKEMVLVLVTRLLPLARSRICGSPASPTKQCPVFRGDEHDRKILDMCPYLDSTGLCELFDQGPEHEDKRITHENPHSNHLDNDENSWSSVAFTVISIGMLLALCSRFLPRSCRSKQTILKL